MVTDIVTVNLVEVFKEQLDGRIETIGTTNIDDDNYLDHLGGRYFDFNVSWMKVRTQHSNHVVLSIIAMNCFSQFLLWSSDCWNFRW